jgi:hypothetical protein
MVTLTGAWLNPRSFTISAEDAARHLGRIVRFGGTVKGWWTVLQHGLLVARLARKRTNNPRIELCGQHHDNAEILTGDVVRPWKGHETKALQDAIDTMIGASMGLPEFTAGERAIIKECDDLACNVEAHIMAPPVVERHPTAFGPREDAERHLRDGLFDGLWTGDLSFDMRSTWEADGALVKLFVAEHERLMRACGQEIRQPRTVSFPGVGGILPRDDREAVT